MLTNYAGQLYHRLTKVIIPAVREDDWLMDDVGDFERAAADIRQAEHFMLPDNGVIFCDQLKGLRGVPIRLPFPVITLEFNTPVPDDATLRWVMVAREYPINLMTPPWGEKYNLEGFTHFMEVYAFTKHQLSDWIPIPGAYTVPTGIESFDVFKTSLLHPATMFERYRQAYAQQANSIEFVNTDAKATLANAFRAVLELCEALACSNVSAPIANRVPPAVAQSRRKKGKLPIYEMRVLTIDTAVEQSHAGNKPVTGRHGVKQHLRRGHVRNLASGLKIWVNACVVGDPNKGVVDKSHAVKH